MQKTPYILIFLFLTSCTSNTIFKKPDDLISEQEMANLLTDLYISAAAKPLKNIQQKRNVNYNHLVFEKYGIDSAQFKRSNFYYTTKIDEYESIYKKVEANLEKLNKTYKLMKKEKDSVKKALSISKTEK